MGNPVTVFYHIFILQLDEGRFMSTPSKQRKRQVHSAAIRHPDEQGDATIIGPPEFRFDPDAMFGARVLLHLRSLSCLFKTDSWVTE